MSMHFRRKRDWSDLIRTVGIHFLTLIVLFCVFISNVAPQLGEMVLNLAAGLMCLLLILASFKGVRLLGFQTALPFVLLIFWSVFQCIDMPITWVDRISPASSEIWRLNPLLSISNDSKVPISLSAARSVSQIQLFWVAALIIVFTCTFITNSREFEKFARSMIIVGIAVCLLALAQQLAGNGKIYWMYDIGHRGLAGPFVNYSNLGQFLIITIGLGVMLLLHRWHSSHGQGRKSRHTFRSRLLSGLPEVKYAKLVSAFIVLSIAVIVLSSGRMALVSTGSAFLVTLIILSLNDSKKVLDWRPIIVGLVIVCTVLISLDISGRFAALKDDNSFQIRKDQIDTISEIIQVHLLTGIGTGALRYVYPFYNELPLPAGSAVWDSDVWYFQLIAEIGLIGMILVGVILLQASRYLYRLARDSSRRMMIYGFIFISVGLSLSFSTDFGLVRPAIFISLAIVFGILRSMSSRSEETEKLGQLRHMGQIMMLAGCLALSVITTADKYVRWQASSVWQRMNNLESKIAGLNDAEAKVRLLNRAVDLGEMALLMDNRDVRQTCKWLELIINESLSDQDQSRNRLAIRQRLVASSRRAPAYYRLVAIRAAFLLVEGGQQNIARASELLELASEYNQKDRLTLMRLSFALLLQGEEALAQAHLKSAMEIGSAQRVINFLVSVKRVDLLPGLLKEASLKDINYAYSRLATESSEHEKLAAIEQIFVDRFQTIKEEKASESYALYAIYLRRLARYAESLESISTAIRKGASVKKVKHWRLIRIGIYEDLRLQDEKVFKQSHLNDYKSELRKLIRVFPERQGLKKKLAEAF